MTIRRLVTGLGVVLLVMPAVLRADEAEDRAVRAVEKLGGKIARDDKARGKPVIRVNLSGTKVTDADLKNLAALPHLEVLNLTGTRVTDAGLKDLAALKQLQALYLMGTPVTDAGVKELAALPQIRLLDLRSTKVTDAGVNFLLKAIPHTCSIQQGSVKGPGRHP